MSTILNNLHAYGLEVHIHRHDNESYNVDINDNNKPDDEDKLVAGYVVDGDDEHAEFFTKAWIDGFITGKGRI